MKVKRRRPERSLEEKKSILKDYKSDMKIADIMDKYKVSKAGIYYIIDQLNKKN